jgi:hypothetical protein
MAMSIAISCALQLIKPPDFNIFSSEQNILSMLVNLELSVPVWGSANNNKPSLVGMQLPEKYKANFDVLSEGLSSTS